MERVKIQLLMDCNDVSVPVKLLLQFASKQSYYLLKCECALHKINTFLVRYQCIDWKRYKIRAKNSKNVTNTRV